MLYEHVWYLNTHIVIFICAGIDDVTPRQKLKDEKALTVDRGYKACDQFIADFGKVCIYMHAHTWMCALLSVHHGLQEGVV